MKSQTIGSVEDSGGEEELRPTPKGKALTLTHGVNRAGTRCIKCRI